MNMKLVKSLVIGAALSCSNAFAAFDADYDIGNWIQSAEDAAGDPVAPVGVINTAAAPLNITLTSGDDGSGDQHSTIFSVAIAATGILSFDWSYTSSDGSAFWDPFGYELDGTVTQVTANGGGVNQNGTVSIAVTAGQIFGFRQSTRDNLFGSASTTISNFSAPNAVSPVPVPPSLGLFGFALGGLVMMQRRKEQ